MQTSAAGAAAVGLGSSGLHAAEKPQSRRTSANDELRIGVIGLRGRGRAHLHGFQRLSGVEVVALADVDENVLDTTLDALEQKSGRRAKRFVDLRAMLDDREIDAVSIATPNHWHALAGIWAMQAGKDVYVEKPCCHNIWEGRQLVAAARKYDRLCQHGTQGRSAPAVREAIEKLAEGVIGQVYMARGLCFKWRDTIGRTTGESLPSGVDYDLWLGPAPKRRYSRNRFHYNWHWHWDYGNGELGNQGVHEMDLARWGLGVGLPRKIQAGRGRYEVADKTAAGTRGSSQLAVESTIGTGASPRFVRRRSMFDDDQETPNTLTCTYEYPEEQKLLVFEVRHWATNHEEFGSGAENATGVTFYGSEGFMRVECHRYETYLGRDREPGPKNQSGDNPFGMFCHALRTRRQEDLAVEIEDGFLSSALCHLGNIAYRAGRTIRFDPETETISEPVEAAPLLTREYRSPFVVPTVG